MKKKLTGAGVIVFIIAALSFTAFAPQQKPVNEKKEQQAGKKDQDKKTGKPDNAGKGNAADNSQKGQPGDKGNKADKGQAMGNQGQGNNKGMSDDMGAMKGNRGGQDGYSWDPVTFKDRKKVRNQEKVTICHKFGRADEPDVTIRVSSNALKAHMDHGDIMGACPPASGRFSDIFGRRRTDYYNILQESQEQVVYSKSILDYARERLEYYRAQQEAMRRANAAAADLERRQVIVVTLEREVSLLETLANATANLLLNKLQ